MNVYLIVEDGESFCIRADTMAQAIKTTEAMYIAERRKDEGESFSFTDEKSFYHEQILESCALVGELRNI